MKFLIASNNAHKIKELNDILNALGVETVKPKDLGICCEVEETGTTFEENAMLKAKNGYLLSSLPTIADDSGLAVDALNGRPGIYSARYAGEDATDGQKIEKLLGELDGVKDRGAKFVSAVAFYCGDESFTVLGECKGSIATEPKGENGFGYDPVFVPEGYTESYAQISSEEKNRISHRARALVKFKEKITEYLNK